MIPDGHVLERRVKAFHGLPWHLPAVTIVQMETSDLDRLSAATWSPGASEWVLRRIVHRIESDAQDQAA